MIKAIIDGATDPEKLARPAHPRLTATSASLKAALRGRVTDHYRLMLRNFLDQIDATTVNIRRIEETVQKALDDVREAVELPGTI